MVYNHKSIKTLAEVTGLIVFTLMQNLCKIHKTYLAKVEEFIYTVQIVMPPQTTFN